MKKLFKFAASCILTVFLPCIAFAATSGECGQYARWTLDDNGTLTISGGGDIFGSPPEFKSAINVIIEDTITEIGKGTFKDCTQLTSITIPDNIQSIDDYAFENCTSLESITLPRGLVSIDHDLFKNCTALKSITIPYNVSGIAASAFSGCTSLESVVLPRNLIALGPWVFNNCSSLKEITLPFNLSSFDASVFSGCSSLVSINASGSHLLSNNGVLFNKDMTELLVYPPGRKGAYTVPDSVTSIANGAFDGCTYLTSVVLPDSVTSVGNKLFRNCTSLDAVTLSDNISILSDNSFAGCSSLTKITLPGHMTTISDFAFYECVSLKNVYIPATVSQIGKGAFAGCTSLHNIAISDSNRAYTSSDGVLFSKDMTKLIAYPNAKGDVYTIPDNVKSIEPYAFNRCANLKNVIIPDSVTQISECTFSNCTSLESITIPKRIQNIGIFAFKECSSLKHIYYRGSVDDWTALDIENGNEVLSEANIYPDFNFQTISELTVTANENSYAFTFDIKNTEKNARLITLIFRDEMIIGVNAQPLSIGRSRRSIEVKGETADGAKMLVWSSSNGNSYIHTIYETDL